MKYPEGAEENYEILSSKMFLEGCYFVMVLIRMSWNGHL
jgi:hypothetical protein